jgi:Macrocin-O-methyltransferase (TylF)
VCAQPSVPSNVELHKGWFQDTLPPFVAAHPNEAVAMLHVDCDIYSSTVTILQNIGPMLRTGSVIVYDDLFNCKC